MSVDYTTVGLIRNFRRRGFLPTGTGFTTSDALETLSEQLRSYIPAFLKGIREEYIVAQLSIAVTSGTVPIPVRACGAALRTIGWLRSDGRTTPLARVEPERRADYSATGEPLGYMFQGNNCILLPAPTSGTLVVSYQQRPGQLVLPTACAVVTNTTNTGVTVPVVAGYPSTFGIGAVCDIVGAAPNFTLKAMDIVIASVAAGSFTFTTAVPSGITTFDYVCLASETPIPQVPYEVHDLLAQAAAYQVASDTGSTRLPAIERALKELRAQLTILLSPRSDGSARAVVNRGRLGRRWI